MIICTLIIGHPLLAHKQEMLDVALYCTMRSSQLKHVLFILLIGYIHYESVALPLFCELLTAIKILWELAFMSISFLFMIHLGMTLGRFLFSQLSCSILGAHVQNIPRNAWGVMVPLALYYTLCPKLACALDTTSSPPQDNCNISLLSLIQGFPNSAIRFCESVYRFFFSSHVYLGVAIALISSSFSCLELSNDTIFFRFFDPRSLDVQNQQNASVFPKNHIITFSAVNFGMFIFILWGLSTNLAFAALVVSTCAFLFYLIELSSRCGPKVSYRISFAISCLVSVLYYQRLRKNAQKMSAIEQDKHQPTSSDSDAQNAQSSLLSVGINGIYTVFSAIVIKLNIVDPIFRYWCSIRHRYKQFLHQIISSSSIVTQIFRTLKVNSRCICKKMGDFFLPFVACIRRHDCSKNSK